jgi:Predicted thioesterase
MSDVISRESNVELFARKEVTVRFNEVDSMGIVWHGSYVKYFEDAREEFGKKYDIGYLKIFGEGYYAPLVNIDFNFKKPLVYGDTAIVEIRYIPHEAAKICFEYKIYSAKDNSLVATGTSVQVFLDKKYELIWCKPEFYSKWCKLYRVDI